MNAVNIVIIRITEIIMIVVAISGSNIAHVFSLMLLPLISLLEVPFTESFGAVDGRHSERLNVEIFKVFTTCNPTCIRLYAWVIATEWGAGVSYF